MSSSKARQEICVFARNGERVAPGLLVQPAPVGGFRQVQELDVQRGGLGSCSLSEAHILLEVAIFDRELGQGDAHSRMRLLSCDVCYQVSSFQVKRQEHAEV